MSLKETIFSIHEIISDRLGLPFTTHVSDAINVF